MSDTTVHLEPIAFVVRIFSGGRTFGQPYDWCATAVRIAPETLEIMGALRAPTGAEYRALQRGLLAMGWKKVFYRRKREDGLEEVHEAPTHEDGDRQAKMTPALKVATTDYMDDSARKRAAMAAIANMLGTCAGRLEVLLPSDAGQGIAAGIRERVGQIEVFAGLKPEIGVPPAGGQG